MYNTPLRYPGGKSMMTSFFEELIMFNHMDHVIYAEAYAGGSGAAINLLLKNKVDTIYINDASIAIYSFWHYLMKESDRFINKIEDTSVTLEEWQQQRQIFKSALVPSFDLGFATFFLSRTNRSGILNAGPIGGQNVEIQKSASYKIDCRFNKPTLIEKINKILEKKNSIFVSNLDALDFLHNMGGVNTLVYLDPPYYKQGEALYLNYYKHKDHEELCNFLRLPRDFKWILSYDNVPEIRELYVDFNIYQFELNYSAQKSKKGSEMLTHSENLILPEKPGIKRSRDHLIINPHEEIALEF